MDGTAARVQSFRTASARPVCLNARQASGLSSSFSQRHSTHSPTFSGSRGLQRQWSLTITRAESQSSSDSKDDGKDTPLSFSSKEHEYRSMLLKYVTEVEPSVVDSFSRTAPNDIVEAIRITVGSLLGSLPAQFFEVNVVTLGDNMRSLMYSFLMTGYMYRHISDKLDLQSDIAHSLSGNLEEELARKKRLMRRPRDEYTEGSGKDSVSGHVTRWHVQNGVETIDASEYISSLEEEIKKLQKQAESRAGESYDEPNHIIKYMRRVPASRMHAVRAGPEVTEAMEAFLQRLLGTSETAELNTMVSETSTTELQRLLFWIAIVGYTLRGMEVRFSMEQSFTLPYVALEDKGLRDNL